MEEAKVKELAGLLEPVADRLEPAEAWSVIHELFTRPPNAAVAETKVFDQNSVDSGVGQLTAEQEALNEKKWWLALVEIRRGFIDPSGKLIEKRERDTPATPVYEVSVSGVRYRIGNESQNLEAVVGQMRHLVAEKLRERFGDAYSDESVSVTIPPTEPTKIFIPHPLLRESKSAAKDKEDAAQNQGILFEFHVKWLQPIRKPADVVPAEKKE
jgi:hypothetical protein